MEATETKAYRRAFDASMAGGMSTQKAHEYGLEMVERSVATVPALVPIKCAELGSVSTGTLREEDLIPAFTSELKRQLRRSGEHFAHPSTVDHRAKLGDLITEAMACVDDDGELVPEHMDNAPELVSELCDALSEFSPAYCYFGAHPGDGADFGFWVGEIEGVKGQVEFCSSRAEEYPPDDFRGEWLHVSDHGNCALYVRGADGADVEVWGAV